MGHGSVSRKLSLNQLLWTSSGRRNWTDGTLNPPAWVDQNVGLTLFFCDLHTLSSSSTFSSHFLPSPQIYGDWNNHETFWNPKHDISSCCLSNFAEIKWYIFNLIWDFWFVSYFLYWLRVCNTLLFVFVSWFSYLL
jgi:hypothetical protein